MEVKIQIPDNCELIKDGDIYIVREKNQGPPRSWEEFCERYPIDKSEYYIDSDGEILSIYPECVGDKREDKNYCSSKEEAEAFLALMQLMQLRKAWVGDWEPARPEQYSVITADMRNNRVDCFYGHWSYRNPLSFPTKEMAEDFLSCFRDLCETAKILL